MTNTLFQKLIETKTEADALEVRFALGKEVEQFKEEKEEINTPTIYRNTVKEVEDFHVPEFIQRYRERKALREQEVPMFIRRRRMNRKF